MKAYWELSIGMCHSSSANDECNVSDGILVPIGLIGARYITLPTPHWLRTVTWTVISANQKGPCAAVRVLQTRYIYISTVIYVLFISRLV